MSQVPLLLLRVKVTDPGLGLPLTNAVWLQGATAMSPLTEGLQISSSLMPWAFLMAFCRSLDMVGQIALAAATLLDSYALFQRCSRRSLMSTTSSLPPAVDGAGAAGLASAALRASTRTVTSRGLVPAALLAIRVYFASLVGST